MTRCSICKFTIEADDDTTICSTCNSQYHTVCWESIGGCAVYGCSSAAQAEKEPVLELVGKGWGDEKQCPSCSRMIPSSLLICSCGAKFPWAEPMSRSAYHEWLRQEEIRAGKRNNLVWLFLASLLAVTAPITGAIAGFYAYRNRHELAGKYGAFLALGYGTALMGAVYSLIFLALLLGL